jgi:NTE family protein
VAKPTHTLPIDLALQGGGAHGAFTWGVLDRLLDERHLIVAGVSGTSAGAFNAVALASGLMQGSRRAAQTQLRTLWEGVAHISAWAAPAQTAQEWFDHAWGRWWGNAWGSGANLSPYQFNPLNLNPLRDLLVDCIDFEAVRRSDRVGLFIGTTHVRSGALHVFRTHEVTVDVVLASACLPMLFQAVDIDGEAYWDGGYAGNPSLEPLITESPADDLLLVQINPRQRDEVPTQARDILERSNEITFNTSLLKELRSLALLKQLVQMSDRAPIGPGAHLFRRVQALRVHRIEGDERLAELGAGSKTDTRADALAHLHSLGVQAADAWLRTHGRALGQRATVDLVAECGVGRGQGAPR